MMHPFLTEVTRVLGERPMSISELPTIDIKDLMLIVALDL